MKQSIMIIFASVAVFTIATLTTRAAQLVTSSTAGLASISAGGSSLGRTLSGNGRYVAFVSHAGNLVTNTMLQEPLQVFVRDLVASNTVLISVSTNGRGGDANSFGPMISSNGQFIVFASEASDLVSNDTNGLSDVFVHDRASHTTTLVSVDLSGRAPNDTNRTSIIPLSANPLVSPDGQWVFFESRAANLTAVSDTNNATDVFARNLHTNLTFVVSLDATGASTADGTSTLAGISADARYVAFISTATNIAAGGTNAAGDLYRRDMVSGARQCATKNVGSLLSGAYRCGNAALSANGRYAAFATIGTSNAVFRHDFDSDATALISLCTTNAEGAVSISADGRYVIFDDGANVLRFDANTSTTQLVNVAANGAQPGSGIARNPVATPDGNGIVFISNCPDLVTNGSSLSQVYARDMVAGATRLITVATNGQPSTTNNEVSSLAVSPDFSRVVFDSTAADLVAGDGNRASDVFIRDLVGGTTSLVSQRGPASPRTSGVAYSYLSRDAVSADGRFVVFSSYDDDLLPDDENVWPDIFVRDLVTGTVATPELATNVLKFPVISANGRYVAYPRFTYTSTASSSSTDLPLFRFDRLSGTNELVTSSPAFSSSGPGSRPAISADGNLVVWRNRVSIETPQIMLRDMIAGTNHLVSVPPNGIGIGSPLNPLLSGDSRWVLFESDTGGGFFQLFAHDLQSNITHQVSFSTQGSYRLGSAAWSGNSRFVAFSSTDGSIRMHDLVTHTNMFVDSRSLNDLGRSRTPALNSDGRYVAYAKRPSGGTFDQIYVCDLVNTQIDLVSMNVSGGAANGDSTLPLLSGDGRFVVFQSKASDLVANDANQVADIFIRDRTLGVTMLVSANARGFAGNGSSTSPILAADGRTVFFQSFASDIGVEDYNDKRGIFVLKLGGADTDGDGMDDDWEAAYFGNLSRNGSGDFDGDGASDLAEFLAGTDPTNGGSVFRVLTVRPFGGSSTQVIWTGNPSRSYRVEFKDDLAASNWTAVNGSISWNGSTASITDTSAASGATRYYRAVRLP